MINTNPRAAAHILISEIELLARYTNAKVEDYSKTEKLNWKPSVWMLAPAGDFVQAVSPEEEML